jgi:hypothetical protein
MSDGELYTLVRHAGYAQAGNPDFEQAVEVTGVTRTQSYLVRRAGGLLVESLAAAEAAASAANQPAGAPGHFASVRLGVADLYIPN